MSVQSDLMDLPMYFGYKQEQSFIDSSYKKQFCRDFLKNQPCKRQFLCRDAHGTNDLMPISDFGHNMLTINNLVKLKRLPCSQFYTVGFCNNGINCDYSHHDTMIKKLFKPSNNVFENRCLYKRPKTFISFTQELDDTLSTIDSSSQDASLIIYDSSSKRKGSDEGIDLIKHAEFGKKASKLSQLINGSRQSLK